MVKYLHSTLLLRRTLSFTLYLYEYRKTTKRQHCSFVFIIKRNRNRIERKLIAVAHSADSPQRPSKVEVSWWRIVEAIMLEMLRTRIIESQY